VEDGGAQLDRRVRSVASSSVPRAIPSAEASRSMPAFVATSAARSRAISEAAITWTVSS
jgi:hypothetical protein